MEANMGALGWTGKRIVRKHTRTFENVINHFVERLEQRTLLAAVSWTGAAGDNLWTTGGNWSGNAAPGPLDDVQISIEGNPTVLINSPTQPIHNLVLSNANITAAGLTASLTVSGTATLSTGTISS